MINALPFNEDWAFTITNDPVFANEPIQDGQYVTLPHTWNATDGQGGSESYYRGACWYQKTFHLEKEHATKQIYLEIGAAGNMGQVYVNGQLAGQSRCGYAMFRVNLKPYLKTGDNLISVRVDNSYDNEVLPLLADFTFYGGLYREVKLLLLEDIHFDTMDNGRDGIYLSQAKTGEHTFQLTVNGQIVNACGESQQAVIFLELQDADGNFVLKADTTIKVEERAEFALNVQVENPVLWDGVEQPYLYRALVSVVVNGVVRDKRTVSVGFRTVEATTDRGLLLNGKPVKINGVCRHQDFGGKGNAITEADMDTDMALILEVGANSVRLAHYQHDDYFYSLCDHYGLLVWAEIPYISIPSTKDPGNGNAFEQLERLIKQAYNHCSIYCWGVQNEITIAVETEQTHITIKNLVQLANELDPNRLTVQANINGVADDSVINSYTDLVGYNLYYGWYYGELKDLGDRLDAFHNVNPTIPMYVSEYGVDTNPRFHSYSPKVQDYTEEYQLMFHHNALETINARPFVQGGYVWNMFDFGSANRNEGGETGKNQKGLVSIDRKLKKDAFYLYKAYWSDEPFVHLGGRRFVNRHQEENDIIVISNLLHVRIYRNGELVAEISNSEKIKTAKGVRLSDGQNTIRVTGLDEAGNTYTDEIVLQLVRETDPAYIYVKNEEKRHVVNWFEKFDLSNTETLELKEDCFSTFDTIEDLFENEHAKAVFEKYFAHVTNNPFFEVTKQVMSIEKMAQLTFYNIPPELLIVINKELNVIPKK